MHICFNKLSVYILLETNDFLAMAHLVLKFYPFLSFSTSRSWAKTLYSNLSDNISSCIWLVKILSLCPERVDAGHGSEGKRASTIGPDASHQRWLMTALLNPCVKQQSLDFWNVLFVYHRLLWSIWARFNNF